MLRTGDMQFGDAPTGVYLTDQDCERFYAAVYTVMRGRQDPISLDTAAQLLELLHEAEDGEVRDVQYLKPYEDCRVASDSHPARHLGGGAT
jgi:hypothetical protein